MRENILQAFQGVWSHKLRSFLTMLGIIIGIAAIIAIVSTIKGTNEQIKQNLIGSGNNAVTVNLYQDDYELDMTWGEIPEGIGVISPETKASLNELKGVEATSLFRHRGYTDGVYYGNTAFNGDLYGIDGDYFGVYDYTLRKGRNFLQSDYDLSRKVAILDAKAVSTLFNGEDAVGKTIEIMAEPFIVVGVVETVSTFRPVIETLNDYYLYADTSSGHIFVPDAVWPILYRFDEPQSVAVKAASTDDMAAAGKAVADALTKSQIGDEESRYSYQNRDLLEQAQQLQEMSNATNRQLIWIASISLLVGGIGVMKAPDPGPVPHRGRRAHLHRRRAGSCRRSRGIEGALENLRNAFGHQPPGHRHRRGLLHARGRHLRPAPGHEGREHEPHRGAEAGVIRIAKKPGLPLVRQARFYLPSINFSFSSRGSCLISHSRRMAACLVSKRSV